MTLPTDRHLFNLNLRLEEVRGAVSLCAEARTTDELWTAWEQLHKSSRRWQDGLFIVLGQCNHWTERNEKYTNEQTNPTPTSPREARAKPTLDSILDMLGEKK